MNEVLGVLLKIIVMIVVPVLTSVGTYYLKKYVNAFIENKTDGETEAALRKGFNIILDSVNYVQQTFVDTLKKENKFDEQAAKEAFDAAKERALELMNTDIINAIESSYNNLDVYVKTIIESIIAGNKQQG